MTNLRLVLGLAFGLLTVPGLAVSTPPPPQQPVDEADAPRFPGGVDVVTVDAVVLDRDGNPIEGLTADDFTVRDEGRLRPITSFEAVTLPESPPAALRPCARASRRTPRPEPRPERTFVIVFDNVHIAPGRAQRAKDGSRPVLWTTASPTGDRVVRHPHLRRGLVERPNARGSRGHRGRARPAPGRAPAGPGARPDLRLRGDAPLPPPRPADGRRGRPAILREPRDPRASGDRGALADLDLGEGHPLIRIKAAEVYQAARSRQSRPPSRPSSASPRPWPTRRAASRFCSSPRASSRSPTSRSSRTWSRRRARPTPSSTSSTRGG